VADLFVNLFVKEDKSIGSFRITIRQAVRNLWSGDISRRRFRSTMRKAIISANREAWESGMAVCGMTTDEITRSEIRARSKAISQQLGFVGGFTRDIVGGRDKELQGFLNRSELWVNRYNETRSLAQAMACKDLPGMWKIGKTDHCRSCQGFNGRVYRMSVWKENGALPQTRKLCCNGYACGCEIVKTDKRVTPGRFPKHLLCE